MRNITILAFFLTTVWVVPVQAMTACDLAKLVPMDRDDYDRVRGLIHQQPGCVSDPADSAHSQSWTCSIKFADGDEDKRTFLLLIREPNTIPNLFVMTSGLENLNALRACDSSAGASVAFEPLNILERDHVRLRSGGSYYLNTLFPDIVSVLISNHSSFYRNQGYYHLLEAQFGIKPPPSAYTAIRFAGADPFKVSAKSITDAYISRGSEIISSSTEAKAITRWALTPSVGLGGVTKVEIESVGHNLNTLKYHFENISDYQEFVRILDGEYGASELVPYNECNLRRWKSGDVRAVGRYCPKEGLEIEFINMLAHDQLSAAIEKYEEQKQSKPQPSKPEIDRDML